MVRSRARRGVSNHGHKRVLPSFETTALRTALVGMTAEFVARPASTERKESK
jgi:hypothetical protein